MCEVSLFSVYMRGRIVEVRGKDQDRGYQDGDFEGT